MSSNYRTSASRAAKYDYLIKLLLIGDSGEFIEHTAMPFPHLRISKIV